MFTALSRSEIQVQWKSELTKDNGLTASEFKALSYAEICGSLSLEETKGLVLRVRKQI